MRYTNPVVKGFYPDPSVCRANGKYYMVCSSFQYFPAIPLFESEDLVNWNQLGHVLTRESQVMLDGVASSGGVFAATIRFHQGRFYVVTTNNSTQENFFVYADDIHGPWSEPVRVDQGGIDPSLYFENGHTYFMSNGLDDQGQPGIAQCEIDPCTGQKRSPSRSIWQGTGGRFLESPHLYKIADHYYLMAAEGGTEYGHMITMARADSLWGPFIPFPENPLLTNRNRAPYLIQGIGHGDLVQGPDGGWYILSLGFRQIDLWMAYHHLGREVFLTPIRLDADGWFRAGHGGTTEFCYEIPGDFVQQEKRLYTFENTRWDVDWCFLRHPHRENYTLLEDRAILRGTAVTLEACASPTFVGLRQRDFCGEVSCEVRLDGGEAGLTVYMSEWEHYDLALRPGEAVLKLHIGDAKHLAARIPLTGKQAKLTIRMEPKAYHFYVSDGAREFCLGHAQSKYLSTEVSGGFTGVMLGLYAIEGVGEFREYRYEIQQAAPAEVVC